MNRVEYFNPVIESLAEDNYEDPMSLLIPPTASHPANVVSSLADDGLHYPALDIDIPCRYVPSSTPGHGHLYFDELALTWDQYADLLVALVNAGIIEDGYGAVSIKRRQTVLRKPGVHKKEVSK